MHASSSAGSLVNADILEQPCSRSFVLAVSVASGDVLFCFMPLLFSGLPKQTVGQWEHTLSEAVSTGATHISVYDLQVHMLVAFCVGWVVLPWCPK